MDIAVVTYLGSKMYKERIYQPDDGTESLHDILGQNSERKGKKPRFWSPAVSFTWGHVSLHGCKMRRLG